MAELTPTYTPHTTYLVLPPPKSNASSTAGVSIGRDRLRSVKRERPQVHYNTKAIGNSVMNGRT